MHVYKALYASGMCREYVHAQNLERKQTRILHFSFTNAKENIFKENNRQA